MNRVSSLSRRSISSLTGLSRTPAFFSRGTGQTKPHRRTLKRRLLAESLESRRLLAVGPFSPAAEQPGSTAIAADSTEFVGFATGVVDFQAGTDVDPQFQTPLNALGISDTVDGSPAQIVSLGRGGQITLEFAAPIEDGPGADFAVFENSFSDTFLELAFVEVSSDGVEFVRFDTESLTPDLVGSFGSVDPTDVDGFAGNFRAGFGTGFDLSDLDTTGTSVNVNAITQVRIIDVVGDGNDLDTSGDPIFDPFPTTGAAGFDLDAVGVINQADVLRSVVDFEDVGPLLGPNGAFAGPAANGVIVPGPFGDSINGTIESENLSFTNNVLQGTDVFDGFAFSNVSDTTTPGVINQFASFSGSGAGGSEFYAVGFVGQATNNGLPTIMLEDDDERQFESIQVTNTTFTALSLLNGDQFADPFGGPSGDEPDLLTLTISGLDADGNSIGEVEFILADFRFDDNSQDFIVDEFTTVDLSSIASARALQFDINSTDVGPFGINTPAYFAIDDIVLAEPLLAAELTSVSIVESAGSAATLLQLRRSAGFTSQSLAVSLAADDSLGIDLPDEVTIPAGVAEVTVPIDVINNDSTTDNSPVTITASATGFEDSIVVLQIENDDIELALSGDLSANEGDDSAELTVTRQTSDTLSELVVTLSSSDISELTVPPTVTIPFGQSSATFSITAVADQLVDGNQTVQVTALAPGFVSATTDFTVNDVDTEQLTLSLPAIIAEDAGIATATIARNTEDTSAALFVNLVSSDPARLGVPAVATIPAGSLTADFEFTVVDNEILGDSQSVTVTASTNDGLTDEQTIEVIDDEQFAPMIQITIDPATASESDAPVTVDFETVGATLADESTLDQFGPVGINLLDLGPVTVNNEVGDFGFSSGFAITNSTDNVTPDFSNLFGNVTGSGALESSTFAVVNAFPGSTVPTITLNDPTLTFESIAVTNTTFAAEVIANGNAFADPFGGPTGDEPDVFTLTIEGFDDDGESVGTVDFALADFSSDDPTLDFIVDEFVALDLTSLVGATSLGFFLDSSDVGAFGINTPAFFAVDNLVLGSASDTPAALGTVTRANTPIDQPLEVTLQVSDPTEVAVPSGVTIPAGAQEVTFPVGVFDDAVVDGDQSVLVTATADDLPNATATVIVADDDPLELVLTVAVDSISEDAGVTSVVLTRNEADLTQDLLVELESSLPTSITVPATVTIPAGVRGISVDLTINDNEDLDGDQSVNLTAFSSDRPAALESITVTDDEQFDPALIVSVSPALVSESDAPLTIGFEDLGAFLADEAFDNGADLSGGFQSGPVSLNNEFNTEFGSFSAFAISTVTDNVTPDFTNLFGNVTGSGALGSRTFAVADAFPGGTVPTITLSDPDLVFDSIQVTNTTFTAAVIQNGNAFAEPFGGETGDDPDVFTLTIEGLDNAGQSIGTIDFVLADFRFDDNAQDFVIDEFVTVDLSSLSGASELTFSVDSTDVGPFGINTPAFFAIDNLVLIDPDVDTQSAIGTVTRINSDTSAALEVAVATSDASELSVPSFVTIPAGQASATFPIDVIDDFVVDGAQIVSVTAGADGFFAGSAEVTVADDETPLLTATVSAESILEGSAGVETLLITHNLSSLEEPLEITATVVGEGFSLETPIVILPGASSIDVPIEVIDDAIAVGDRVVDISLTAVGFPSTDVSIAILEDDVTEIITSVDGGELTVTELIGPAPLLVSLASEPTGTVTIQASTTSDQIGFSPTVLTFTPDNFDQPQTITVTGVADLLLEETLAATIELVATGENPDEPFDGVTTTANVSLVDFSLAEIQISESIDTIVVSEPVLGLAIIEETLETGVAVVASSDSQSILIEPLASVRGPVFIDAGGGDDVVTLQSERFTLLDGGDGIDTLLVQLDGVVDLVDLLDQQIFGFEQYVFAPLSTEDLSVTFDVSSADLLFDPDQPVTIETLGGVLLDFVGGPVVSTPVVENGILAQVVTVDGIEIRVESAEALRNVVAPADVNGSGDVTPLDALLIINQLAEGVIAGLPVFDSLEDFEGFFDVNGDDAITPLDALLVINSLIDSQVAQQTSVSATEFTSQSLPSPGTASVDRAIEQLFVVEDEEEFDLADAELGLIF